VRPLASQGALVARLFAIFAVIAAAGALVLGYAGIRRMDPGTAVAIFGALAGFTLLTAGAATSAMVPGSPRPFHPAVIAAGGCATLVAVFAVVFPDRTLGRFVPQGIACLRAGVTFAIPAALATWLALRRGFAVDRRAAAIAAGTFAGLTGLAVLELHCPNFRLPHVAVWHVAVPPLGAAAGYFLGSKRSDAELMQ